MKLPLLLRGIGAARAQLHRYSSGRRAGAAPERPRFSLSRERSRSAPLREKAHRASAMAWCVVGYCTRRIAPHPDPRARRSPNERCPPLAVPLPTSLSASLRRWCAPGACIALPPYPLVGLDGTREREGCQGRVDDPIRVYRYRTGLATLLARRPDVSRRSAAPPRAERKRGTARPLGSGRGAAHREADLVVLNRLD